MATDCTNEGPGLIGTQYPDVFAMLAAPFEPDELRWREGPGGEKLFYIRARTAMNRLDNVVGPENWDEKYALFGDDGSIRCVLVLTLPGGRKVCKSGIGSPGKADQNADKSAESDAFKRACVKFGIARYLYKDGVPTFVAERTSLEGPAIPLTPQAEQKLAGSQGRIEPGPQGPVNQPSRPAQDQRRAALAPEQDRPRGDAAPRTGKALYAWVMKQQEKYDVALLVYMNTWASKQNFPPRMVDWEEDYVLLAHKEAIRKLARVAASEPASAAR